MKERVNISLYEETAMKSETPDALTTLTVKFVTLDDLATSPEENMNKLVPLDTFIGLVLAFCSCFFIGISVILKKLALKDNETRGRTRAVDGGYGYLRLPRWWLGISLMAVGEITNFVAYIFAPAILVTPLGVFSIVCTATLSPYFLKEHLRTVGKLGCILVLVGCVIVTLCGPKDREVGTMDELQAQLLHPGFLAYASVAVSISVFLMALVPRYGHKYVLFYIIICSSFGSLSVMFCKGVGLALKQTIVGDNGFLHWAAWVCLVSLTVCIIIETIYMQRALDLFNTSVFMSVNYVFFTSLVIVASSILYTELREIGWKNILLTILGFAVNIVALFLLHLDKHSSQDNDQFSKEESKPAEDSEIPSTTCHPEFSPGQDPQTPLMIKNSNLIFKNVDEGSRASPLSNIGLVPVNFNEDGKREVTFLSFLNRTQQHEQRKTLDLCLVSEQNLSRNEANNSESSQSCISCNDECSYSSRSNFSENSSLCSVNDLAKTNDNSETCGTHQSLCEIPLIDELQVSSRQSFPQIMTDTRDLVSEEIEAREDYYIDHSKPKSKVSPEMNQDTKLM